MYVYVLLCNFSPYAYIISRGATKVKFWGENYGVEIWFRRTMRFEIWFRRTMMLGRPEAGVGKMHNSHKYPGFVFVQV